MKLLPRPDSQQKQAKDIMPLVNDSKLHQHHERVEEVVKVVVTVVVSIEQGPVQGGIPTKRRRWVFVVVVIMNQILEHLHPNNSKDVVKYLKIIQNQSTDSTDKVKHIQNQSTDSIDKVTHTRKHPNNSKDVVKNLKII